MPQSPVVPYPPRPRRPPLAEPSIDWRVRFIIALLGARRAMPARAQRRLELSGLPWHEIAGVLSRVRTTEQWGRVWQAATETSAAEGNWERAYAQAYLGQLILSPFHPRKSVLKALARQFHQKARSSRTGVDFQTVSLLGGRIAGYVETPLNAVGPPVLLLPPLASTKEELTLLGDAFLAAGHPVIRMDLPGQGESPPPLSADTETLLAAALDELGVRTLFVGGISLGAFFALRLAGKQPRGRVRGVFGVSPPAIITPIEWRRQPEVIWQYLDLYFEGSTRAETYEHARRLVLEDVVEHITCPVLLFHGRFDRMSPADAPERYRALLTPADLEQQTLDDGHACLLHLREVIAPTVATWCADIQRRGGKGDK